VIDPTTRVTVDRFEEIGFTFFIEVPEPEQVGASSDGPLDCSDDGDPFPLPHRRRRTAGDGALAVPGSRILPSGTTRLVEGNEAPGRVGQLQKRFDGTGRVPVDERHRHPTPIDRVPRGDIAVRDDLSGARPLVVMTPTIVVGSEVGRRIVQTTQQNSGGRPM